MNIIDIHAHIFPDKIARKASQAIGEFYDIPTLFDGTVEALLRTGRKAGITLSAVHSVATVPGQVQAVNDFIAKTVEEHPGKLIGFATLHPDYPDIHNEVDRVISLGLRGIKLHPDFQRFRLDEPGAFRIFEVIEGRLPVIVHTGDKRYDFSRPARMAAAMERFPGLTAICAHFGGWSEWLDAADVLAGKQNLYVDTSSSLYAIKPEAALGLIRRFGADNVLFGTDYPMWSPVAEVKAVKALGLTNEELEKVMHLNAEKLLGLAP